MTLREYCSKSIKLGDSAASENRMQTVACQIYHVCQLLTDCLGTSGVLVFNTDRCAVQTLKSLHQDAHLAHLDLTSANVMISHVANDWDQVRLLDFGFSMKCNSGSNKVNLPGCEPTTHHIIFGQHVM